MKKIIAFDKKNGYICTAGNRWKTCKSFQKHLKDEMLSNKCIVVASVPSFKKIKIDLETLKVKFDNN